MLYTPTHSPRRSMSASEAPVKLRSACDACSVAKVKCDKKKPVCDRCRTNSFTCSYSPSRRHGKQSWAERVAEQQYLNSAMSTPPTTTPLMTPSLFPFPSLYGANDSLGFGLTPLGLTPAASQPGPLDQMMGADGGDGQGADYSTLVGFDTLGDGLDFLSHWTGVGSGVDLRSGSETSETQVHGTGPNSTSNSISAGETSTPTTSPEDTTSISEPPQPPIHDCEAKAFTTLHSIHYCTMLHTDRPGMLKQTRTSSGNVSNHMPPLDKVLFFNRVAMSTLKELLDCRCAQQPHLALLYMAIISKALFLCQARRAMAARILIRFPQPACVRKQQTAL